MNLCTLKDIKGQDRALEEIRRLLEQGRFRGSFLFSGPNGVGKRATALAIAAALFCPEKPLLGCGQCERCQQLAQESHPDCFFLKPDDKNTIKIDAARKLIRWLNLQPVTSDRKIAIIDNCECLTPQATNALLKSVEEPGDSGIFILITSSPGSLLPTLQSRCQQLRFQPLAQDLIRHLLSAQEDWRPETLAAVLPIADGSLSQARLFGQWMESVESDLPALFFTLATQPYYRLVDCLAELPSETLGISCLLTGLRTVCRDLLILLEMGPAGTKRLLFPGSTKLCRNLGTHLQSTAIFQCIATLDEAQAALRQRSTANLIWESVAFSFQKMLKEKIPPSPPLQKGGTANRDLPLS